MNITEAMTDGCLEALRRYKPTGFWRDLNGFEPRAGKAMEELGWCADGWHSYIDWNNNGGRDHVALALAMAVTIGSENK